MIIESKAEGRVPDYVLGRKYTYIRACSLINKILLYGVFSLSLPFHEFLPVEKMRIENTGESCETMRGTSYLEEKEGDGGGGGEEEKKKKKICGTKEKASLIESACCGKCGVKNTVVLDPDDQVRYLPVLSGIPSNE